MGHRSACRETIEAARVAQRYISDSRLKTAASDAIHGKSMSLRRENLLREGLNLPPLRVHHVETAAPKDTRTDMRMRVRRDIGEEAIVNFGSGQAAIVAGLRSIGVEI